MHIQLKERVLKVILLLLIKMDASFRISGTVMIWVNISILWDNVHGEEYLIEEINENLPSYLQIKIWVFPNHSMFGKSHTPPRKYVCVEAWDMVCIFKIFGECGVVFEKPFNIQVCIGKMGWLFFRGNIFVAK